MAASGLGQDGNELLAPVQRHPMISSSSLGHHVVVGHVAQRRNRRAAEYAGLPRAEGFVPAVLKKPAKAT